MEAQHWIHSLCGSRAEWAKTPWVIDGKTYATNGYYLLVIDGAVEGVLPATMQARDNMTRVLDIPAIRLRMAVTVSLADLKTWAGTAEKKTSETIECPECDGAGEEKCSKCGHVAECETCGGKKTIVDVTAPKPRIARLCGELFDCNILATVLEQLGGETCTVEIGVKSYSPARLTGAGWLVVVMPLKDWEGPEGEPFPV